MFAFFEGRAVNAKIKLGKTPMLCISHAKLVVGVVLGIETRILQLQLNT